MMFNENKKKEINDKFHLKIERLEETLTSWQISNFLKVLSSTYYKIELINTLALAINSGIDLKSIFIIDKSFDINTQYSFLGSEGILDLEASSGIKNFFNLGNPITLFPNIDVYNMNIIFILFREINHLFFKFSIIKMEKNILEKVLDIYFKEGVLNATEIIFKNSLEIVEKVEDEKQKKDVLLEIDKRKKEILKKRNRYIKDLPEIEKIEKNILENKKQNLLNNNLNIKKEYFDKFYKYLKDYSRPVIGIFNKKEKKIQILCSSHINKKVRDKRFLDVKNIQHNSPTLILMTMGIGILVPASRLIGNIIQNNKNKIKEKELDNQTDAKIEKLVAQLEELNKFKKSEELGAVNSIELQSLNKKINTILEEENNKMNQIFKMYKFDNILIDIKIEKEN